MNSAKHWVAATSAAIALVLSPVLAHGALMDLDGTSGWQYDTAPGAPGATLDSFFTADGTTTFRLSNDFGNSFDPITIRFKSKAADQEQHFFMVTMLLHHNVPWAGVSISLIDALGVVFDIGDKSHPDRAHIHPNHFVDDGPNNDGLTPDPNVTNGVAGALYEGLLAAMNAWEPERIRLHDMSTTAYDTDTTKRKGPMDFNLVIQPVVPEPSTLLLLGTGLVGLSGAAWRRYRRRS